MDASSSFLEKGRTQGWVLAAPGLTVRCTEGVLWLTREGDPDDHLLGPGERLNLTRGHWVAQALETARFQWIQRPGRKEVSDAQAPVLRVLQRL